MSSVQDTERIQYEPVNKEDNDEMSDKEEDVEDYYETSEEEAEVQSPKLIFNKKECVHFVPGAMIRCGCGLLEEEHNKELLQKYEGPDPICWSAERHIKEFETDAYGRICFRNENYAKYIRVSSKTKAENLVKLMNNDWEMERPNLLLSIVGSAKEPSFQPKLKTFCKGLIDSFGDTGMWIITEGTHAGVMKHVGEAVSRPKDKLNYQNIVCIGIATWGSISNRKALVRNDKGRFLDYEVTENELETSLDMNHSHFILVDSGMYNLNEIDKLTYDLRYRLEKQILQKLDITGNRIPNVLILVEGTPDVLTSILETIKNESPVIVIGDTGQVADLLEFAYNNSEPLIIDLQDKKTGKKCKKKFSFFTDKLKINLFEKIKEIYPNDDVELLRNQVLECIKRRDFITIFKIDDKVDITQIILEALIKAKNIPKITQFKLAMDWNCTDTSHLSSNTLKGTEIEDLLFKAIVEEKTSFMSFFLNAHYDLGKFLLPDEDANTSLNIKESRLVKLFEYYALQETLHSKESIDNLTNVKNIISKQTGTYFEHSFCSQDNKLLDPANILFIWCVLMRYKEMAMIFWQYCKHPIVSALTAQYTSRLMYKRQPDKDYSQIFRDNAQTFGNVAVDLLDKCYNADKKNAIKMLYQQLSEYNNKTIFHMAVKVKNKEFVGHAAYQDLLSVIWNEKLNDDNNSNIKIIFSLMIPFLAPLLIKFNTGLYKQDMPNIARFMSESDVIGTGSKLSYFKKMQYFCSMPFATFYYNCISHFALLILFGIILQTDFYPIDRREHPVISIKEIILIIWMITILMEELRQFFSHEGKTWQTKLYNYTDIWNILDMLSLTLFICGMILRFQPTTSCRLCFYSARIVLTFSLLGFFLRVLHMFSVNKILGPKLVMMGRMIVKLFYFMLILMVVITSYGLASQIIMYPNQEVNILLVKNIYSAAWWDIFGTLSIDEISGKSCNRISSNVSAEECAATYGPTDDWTKCPNRKDLCPANSWVVLIMLAVYVLIVNIMMLNILIAIFNHTFESIESQSNLIWKMQRFHLVLEYKLRPALPPPLICISHFSSIYDYFRKNTEKKASEEKENVDWNNKTIKWKSDIARSFYSDGLKKTYLPADKNESLVIELKNKIEQDKLEIKSLLQKNEEQMCLLLKNFNFGLNILTTKKNKTEKSLNFEEKIQKEKKKLEKSKCDEIVLIQKEYKKKDSSPSKSHSDNKSEDDVKKED